MLTANQILLSERFRVVQTLSADGLDAFHEGFDEITGTRVLIREIGTGIGSVAPSSQLTPARERFASIAAPLAGLKHETIVPIRKYFSEEDSHYLVADLPDGQTLADLLEKKKNPFPVGDASRWTDRLLDGLQHLSDNAPSFVHGFATPQHIWLSPKGHPKFLALDFYRDENHETTSHFDSAMLGFLPIEQIWDGLDVASQKVILISQDEQSGKILQEPLDARSDVYSIGATFYYLLTARVPADALTRSIELIEGNDDPLKSPEKLNAAVPPEVASVVLRALELRRENRFESPSAMKNELRAAFARFKERHAKSASSVAVAPVAESATKTSEPPRAPEADVQRQLEIIRQQLREAEERRIAAEARAAEAEKKLHETLSPSISADYMTIAAQAEPESEMIDDTPDEKRFAEFSMLYDTRRSDSRWLTTIFGAFAALAIVASVGLAVWKYQSLTADTVTPAVVAQPVEEPSYLPAPVPTAEPSPAVSNSVTKPSTEDRAVTETPSSTPETKPETPSTAVKSAPKTVTAATPKPAPQTKKPVQKPEQPTKVTLDDLLKGN